MQTHNFKLLIIYIPNVWPKTCPKQLLLLVRREYVYMQPRNVQSVWNWINNRVYVRKCSIGNVQDLSENAHGSCNGMIWCQYFNKRVYVVRTNFSHMHPSFLFSVIFFVTWPEFQVQHQPESPEYTLQRLRKNQHSKLFW